MKWMTCNRWCWNDWNRFGGEKVRVYSIFCQLVQLAFDLTLSNSAKCVSNSSIQVDSSTVSGQWKKTRPPYGFVKWIIIIINSLRDSECRTVCIRVLPQSELQTAAQCAKPLFIFIFIHRSHCIFIIAYFWRRAFHFSNECAFFLDAFSIYRKQYAVCHMLHLLPTFFLSDFPTTT